MNKTRLMVLLVACVLAVALSFGGIAAGQTGYSTMNNTTPNMNMSMNKTPTINITQPTNGSTIMGPTVTVMVNVTNIDLVDPIIATNVSSNLLNHTLEGHILYFLDYPPVTTPGQSSIPPSSANVTWNMTAKTIFNFTNVSPGPHNVSVELVYNNNTPVQPPANASVDFTVKG
ncbi:MAG TPA: hypothetical protein VE134_08405 [Methanomicrobiales archaeon]|nr:hypothetical protein [Methanomicrobiales archaeon]